MRLLHRRSSAASLVIFFSTAMLLLSGMHTQGFAFSDADTDTHAGESVAARADAPDSYRDVADEETPDSSSEEEVPAVAPHDDQESVSEPPSMPEAADTASSSNDTEDGDSQSSNRTEHVDLDQSAWQDRADTPVSGAQDDNAPEQGRTGFRKASGDVPSFADANDPSIPEVLFANGGTGRFKELIQWMNWADRSHFNDQGAPTGGTNGRYASEIVILGLEDQYPKSTTRHNYRDVGESMRLVTSCTASKLDHSGTRRGFAHGPLVVTIPGAWRVDPLDNIYNRGGENAQNQLVVGLSNTAPQSRYRTGNGASPRFDIVCRAYVWTKDSTGRFGNPRSLPIDGLVVADAESSGYGQISPRRISDEWVEVTTPKAVKWHVLDAFPSPQCQPENGVDVGPDLTNQLEATAQFAVFQENAPQGLETLRLLLNGPECSKGTNPGAVLLAQGTSELTARVQGNGAQAVAMGIIVPTDFGDAPASYGTATAFYHPRWDNEITAIGTNLIRGIRETNMGAAQYRLGDRTGHHARPRYDANASVDADDDAINFTDTRLDVRPGGTNSVTAKCGGDAVVAGWIDWNINGRFDANEKSSEERCANGKVTLRWNVPLEVLRAVKGEALNPDRTFLRLRSAAPGEGSLSPVGATLSGEVEDHAIEIFVPHLRVINEVAQSPYVDNPRPATDWTVEASYLGAGPDAGKRYSARGTIGPVTVPTGDFTLSVRPHAGGEIPHYVSSGWSCAQTEGTSHPLNSPFRATFDEATSRLSIVQADHVTCKVVHTPIPGALSWSKTDMGGRALSGSEWTLTGPSAPQGVKITDCTEAACSAGNGQFVDKDPRAGFLVVEKIKWGAYTLQESRAPAGYVLNPEVKNVSVNGRVDLGAFVNEMRQPLAVPLTGGTASIFYVLAGGGLTVVAVAGAAAIGNRGRSRG